MLLWSQSSVCNTIGGLLAIIIGGMAYRKKEESIDNSQAEARAHAACHRLSAFPPLPLSLLFFFLSQRPAR